MLIYVVGDGKLIGDYIFQERPMIGDGFKVDGKLFVVRGFYYEVSSLSRDCIHLYMNVDSEKHNKKNKKPLYNRNDP